MWFPSNKFLVEWGIIALAIALIAMLIGDVKILSVALIIAKFCFLIAFVRWIVPLATGTPTPPQNRTNPPLP